MVMGRRDILETVLFDSELIVTIGYLSRHADIPIDDAKEELETFYKQNKDKADVHAVYLLSGELNDEHCDGDRRCNKPARCHRIQLVREKNLDVIKRNYRTVDTCEIFCLHSKPIKSLYSMYSVDCIDDDEFAHTDHERNWINCPAAQIKRAEVLQENRESAKLLEEAAKKSERIAHSIRTSQPTTSKSVVHNNDINALFAKAAAKTEHPTPEKSHRKSPFTTPTGEEKAAEQKGANSTDVQKRRARRILIDNEDYGGEKKDLNELKNEKKTTISSQHSDGSNDKRNKRKIHNLRKEETKECKEDNKKGSLALSQEDIFSDGGSSPERTEFSENMEEEKKEVTLSPPKRLRRSPHKVAPSCNAKKTQEMKEEELGTKKPTRKQYVTESFVDEDGYLVTKQVLKEVDVEPTDETKTPHSAVQEPLTAVRSRNVVSMDKPNEKTRAASKRTPHGQAKISSFFKKQ